MPNNVPGVLSAGCIALFIAALFASAASASTLTVKVGNIDSEVGEINVAIYDNKDDWLGDGTVARGSIGAAEQAADGVVTLQFELEPGDYAVSVHHDDNDNGKMDTNFIGIPKEPTGLSNGAVPKFGPPKYKDAVFPLGPEDLEIRIDLLY
jgi:uncharacterized protein (DUF2141 family)